MSASVHRTWLPWLAPLALLIPTLPAPAASTSVMSASDSIATSVGSLSDSVRRSSNSSSKDDKVAEGEHRILEITPLAERPGLLRLRLQALQPGGEVWWLDLPEQAAQLGALAAGQVLRARQRPYGYEFARADDGRPFFLVLEDRWQRELASRPVTL